MYQGDRDWAAASRDPSSGHDGDGAGDDDDDDDADDDDDEEEPKQQRAIENNLTVIESMYFDFFCNVLYLSSADIFPCILG